MRLHKHLPEGHISSWESRDWDNKEYGGGIITPPDSKGLNEGKNKIGSFSGLVEHGDEALILITWLALGWITWDDASRIVDISENELFFPLITSCRKVLSI